MPSKPTFVFVPGNFLPPSYYADIANLLETHGFQTRLVTLPSTGPKSPLTSNKPDITAIHHVLKELSDSGKEIIVVAHSYGGIPTCEAVKGLENEKGHAGVAKLVLIAAWLLQEGQSLPDIIGKYNIEAPWARFEVSYLLSDLPSVLHQDLCLLNLSGWECLRRRSYICSSQRHFRRRRGLLVRIHHSLRPRSFCNPAEVCCLASYPYHLFALRIG